jgi:hypothetical protein
VLAVVPERPLLAPPRALLLRVASEALTERETRLPLHGLARRGDGLEAGVRWWSRRPAAWLKASAPGALGLPGLVTAELSWEEQGYAGDTGEAVERRRRAGLSTADWASPRLRWELAVSGERWTGIGEGISLAGGLRLHLAGERLALLARAEARPALGEGPGFGAWRVGLAARSGPGSQRLEARARASFEAASERAPRGLWPGAGTGHARPTLLRSHPLLEDGVVSGPAFGTRLLAAGAEIELRLARLGPLRLGLAAFLDHARAGLPDAAWGRGLSGAGAGLRFHLPGGRALRIDLATPLDAPGATLSAGWVARWPG